MWPNKRIETDARMDARAAHARRYASFKKKGEI
jgi:hypothetical protein